MPNRTKINLDARRLEIYQLQLLARATERQAEAELERRFGLRMLESRVIAIVATAGATPFKQLVASGQFDKGYASRLVAGLVKKGLILSEVDPGDLRATILHLTAAGQKLFLSIHELATRHNELWLSTLPKAERAAFKSALARLLIQVGERPPRPGLPPPPAPTGAKPRRGRSSANVHSPMATASNHLTPAS
jgi:DNA-binding MarR family transcriptional regulator